MVNFSENTHLSLVERHELIKQVEKEVLHFNFQLYLALLTQLIVSDSVDSILKTNSDDLELNNDDKSIINNFLDKQSNATNKTDFMNITM